MHYIVQYMCVTMFQPCLHHGFKMHSWNVEDVQLKKSSTEKSKLFWIMLSTNIISNTIMKQGNALRVRQEAIYCIIYWILQSKHCFTFYIYIRIKTNKISYRISLQIPKMRTDSSSEGIVFLCSLMLLNPFKRTHVVSSLSPSPLRGKWLNFLFWTEAAWTE